MKRKTLDLLKSNHLIVAFFILGALSILLTFKNRPEKNPMVTEKNATSADTFIPRGYVLVPLELANAESLSSLVGDIGGVVDLFLANTENQKGGLKVGSKLKLLRAPLNPQQYAVLVKESDSSRLLGYAGPFIAVVQNPDEKGNHISTTGPSKLHIEYQN